MIRGFTRESFLGLDPVWFIARWYDRRCKYYQWGWKLLSDPIRAHAILKHEIETPSDRWFLTWESTQPRFFYFTMAFWFLNWDDTELHFQKWVSANGSREADLRREDLNAWPLGPKVTTLPAWPLPVMWGQCPTVELFTKRANYQRKFVRLLSVPYIRVDH